MKKEKQNPTAMPNSPIDRLKALIRKKLTIQQIMDEVKAWENRHDKKAALKLLFRLADAIDEMQKKPQVTFGGQKKLIKKYKLQELGDILHE
jgi:hypothetical protein